jgi:NAD(P)-dependent dehydrogenase (short-subunit alcohol dehydrogenase family)
MGRCMAERLARAGATVHAVDVDEAGLDSLATAHPSVRPVVCDVTDPDAVATAVGDLQVDRLAHCAAIMPGGTLLEMTPAEVNRVMQINYFGMVHVVQTVLPGMLARGSGDVVVFGSIAGEVHTRRFGAYGASKSANNFYMRVLMKEHAGSGLRMLLVCPSAVNTPLIDQATERGPRGLNRFDRDLLMATPDGIIDAVERGLDRGRRVIYPGHSLALHLGYRLAPRLLGRLVNLLA